MKSGNSFFADEKQTIFKNTLPSKFSMLVSYPFTLLIDEREQGREGKSDVINTKVLFS